MEHLGQFIINHWQLWLLFILVLMFTFFNELIAQKKKAKAISPQAAVDFINNQQAVIIDLRDKELFKKGHIIDSIQLKPEDLESKKMEKYKNTPIILVCARGLQSATLANKLSAQGYQSMVLNGGITAWQNADLPLTKGMK